MPQHNACLGHELTEDNFERISPAFGAKMSLYLSDTKVANIMAHVFPTRNGSKREPTLVSSGC